MEGSDRNDGGIVSISSWKLQKAVVCTVPHEDCRETGDLWIPGDERLRTEEYSITS